MNKQKDTACKLSAIPSLAFFLNIKSSLNLRLISNSLYFCLIHILSACSPLLNYETFVVHTVEYSGENPSMISKWYTSKPGNWEKIKIYNGQIANRDLKLGDKVRIPRSLVSAFRQMPASFVKNELRFYSNKSVSEGATNPDKLEDVLIQSLVEEKPTAETIE